MNDQNFPDEMRRPARLWRTPLSPATYCPPKTGAARRTADASDWIATTARNRAFGQTRRFENRGLRTEQFVVAYLEAAQPRCR